MDEILLKLKSKLNEVDQLAQEPAYSAKYQIWNTMTERLLKQCLDEKMVKIFSGILKTSSYLNQNETHRMYLRHLDKKHEALENLISVIETQEVVPQQKLLETELPEQKNNKETDKKRIRKAGFGLNLGIFNAKIEEDREI